MERFARYLLIDAHPRIEMPLHVSVGLVFVSFDAAMSFKLRDIVRKRFGRDAVLDANLLAP